MIECVFTVDYEIYGDGSGALAELVYEPGQKLKEMFDEAGAKIVVFTEAAEFEMIEAAGTDSGSREVRSQLREFFESQHEIALHLHPQWYTGKFQNGQWQLNYAEYNLCPLPRARIQEIVKRAISYLKNVVGDSGFSPVSFRAGNWLFQPTRTAAEVLACAGIKVDSSVFKGGRQHKHGLDYRSALRNGYFWKFRDDVAREDTCGLMLEIPIYTQMVVPWKMASGKRLQLQKKSSTSARKSRGILNRFRDLARLRQPLKLDFCRMTLEEMIGVVEHVRKDDVRTPDTYKPLVAIGHTKDLSDPAAVRSFLAWLKREKIPVVTLQQAMEHCANAPQAELAIA